MTIGQRIAQRRKECSLSQEALGAQIGVSRQAIYKWESDAALPEIDKLIALSRLFGVSVGWLLGVEEPPEASGPAASEELTEQQLKMVEEIAQRYTAALPKPKKTSRWPVRILFAICVLVMGCLVGISGDVKELSNQYGNLQNDISRVENSVNRQIGGISGRVEEILKAQNNLTADYGVEILRADLEKNEVFFSVHAVPKTYTQGMQVEFSADSGSGSVSYADGIAAGDGNYTAELSCSLTDSISLSAIFIAADGTRQTQLLQQFDDLYTASLPSVSLMSFDQLWNMPVEDANDISLPQTYVMVAPRSSVYAVNEAIGQAEIKSVRVGLFKNRSLITFLTPCAQPGNIHGDFDPGSLFFCLPEGTKLSMTESDSLCIAAVVTDVYDRDLVFSDIPLILRDGTLDHPSISDVSNYHPDNWNY